LGHGPLCVLREVSSAKRPEVSDLFMAIISDPRFDQTDPTTIVEMMEQLHEGFPIPKDIPWNGEGAQLPKKAIQQELLPLWRNMLRRHFGLGDAP
jgi:hypothetical protein